MSHAPSSLPRGAFVRFPLGPSPSISSGSSADAQPLRKCKTPEAKAAATSQSLSGTRHLSPPAAPGNTTGLAKDGTVLLGARVSPAARLSRWRSCSKVTPETRPHKPRWRGGQRGEKVGSGRGQGEGRHLLQGPAEPPPVFISQASNAGRWLSSPY